MRPGLRALEARLRRSTRAELRKSRESWREFRSRRRGVRRRASIDWIQPLLIPIIALSFLHAGVDTLPILLLALTLHATGATFLRARELLQGLHASQDLAVLGHLPVSERELFDVQDRKLFWRSGWTLYTCSIVLLTAALGRNAAPGVLAATVALALLQWIGVLGLALALAAWKPRWPLALLGRVFYFLAFLGVTFAKPLGALPWLQGGELMLCFPSGWSSYFFLNGLLGPEPLTLLLLAPAAALTLMPFVARRALRRSYVVEELVTTLSAPPAELILEDAVHREMIRRSEYDQDLVDAPELGPQLRQELREALPAFAEQHLRSGALTHPPEWQSRGPLERFYVRLLGARDLAGADLLLGGDLRWSRAWRRSAVLTVLGSGAAILEPAWISGWPLALLTLVVLWPLFPQKWPGLEPFRSAGQQFPFYAFFPVGYWNGSRILFKAAFVRVGAWSPLILLLGTAFTARGPGPWAGLWIAAKGLLMVAALIPLLTMLKFSVGTDDTLRVRFGSVVCFLLPMMLATIGVVGGGLLLFSPKAEFPGALIPLILLLPAYGAWSLYGISYNRGSLDLIRPGPPG